MRSPHEASKCNPMLRSWRSHRSEPAHSARTAAEQTGFQSTLQNGGRRLHVTIVRPARCLDFLETNS
jgi:hypothetical protein